MYLDSKFPARLGHYVSAVYCDYRRSYELVHCLSPASTCFRLPDLTLLDTGGYYVRFAPALSIYIVSYGLTPSFPARFVRNGG